jgi:enoyl-CoA hydratase/3-hydroxyacyl-CoA dehydrogenase
VCLQLSKPIKAEEGKDLGLVDEIVPSSQLLSAARKVALELASGSRPLVRSLERNDKIEDLDDALEIIKFARKQARATAPNVNHPQACLDAMEAGVRYGGYEGNRKV